MKIKLKTNAVVFFLATLVPSSFTVAAESLQQQISAIAAAENAAKVQEKQEQDAANEEALKIQRAEEQQRAKAAAARAGEKKRLLNERIADKKRDRAYEDELRQLEIEQRKLEVQRKAARVKREGDFIEQDLKYRAAQTDLIQSNADANRNLPGGAKGLIQSEGKSAVKKAEK